MEIKLEMLTKQFYNIFLGFLKKKDPSERRGFTPLEKATDFNQLVLPFKTDGWLKPASGQIVRELHSLTGFSLVELLIATVIFILAFSGVLLSFIRCMELSEMSRNSSIAVAAAKSRMEQVKNTEFSQIVATYDNKSFATGSTNHSGVSYVDNSDPELLEITVTVCWQQRNGLIVGEDTNLNGQLNGGEDLNNNNMLDSPVQLITYIYQE